MKQGTDDGLSYEQALALLDQRIKALEDGDLTLDEALTAAEEAQLYLRVCQQRLDEGRRRIEVRPADQADEVQGPAPA